MRKIVSVAFVSVDGVMQAPGGPDEDTTGGFKYGGWVAPLWDDVLDTAMSDLFSAPFDLLLGRKTYDIFAAYWPNVAADKANGLDALVAKRFDACTKYVATHRPETLRWQNTRSLGKDVVASLRELKQENGPILLTQGSSVLIQTLLANDLIDELGVITFPLTLGRGKRLFGEGTQPGAFKLVRSTTSPQGVLIARYQRGGSVATGRADVHRT